MIFRNASKLGDLDVPGVGLVPFGGTFDAVGDEAEPYLAQPDVYEHVVLHDDGSATVQPSLLKYRASTEPQPVYVQDQAADDDTEPAATEPVPAANEDEEPGA